MNATVSSNPDLLEIIFRCCARVTAVHGDDRGLGITKSQLLIASLGSLIQSIREAQSAGATGFRLTVIDDHSDEQTVSRISQLLQCCDFPTRLLGLKETGNAASLSESYRQGRDSGAELLYFVEDDYLHASSAIAEMLNAYQGLSQRFESLPVIFPCDHPDRYMKSPYPSLIVSGPSRYWRTVLHTTGTFLIPKATLEEFWDVYMKFAQYDMNDPSTCEGATINRIYEHRPCFSPMPTLVLHMHEKDRQSPYVNWREWLDSALNSVKEVL